MMHVENSKGLGNNKKK